MLTKEQMAALLGRSLTSTEDTNFSQYLEIAIARLSNLVCFRPEVAASEASATARKFASRDGYRTLYVDPFTGTPTVTIDGETLTTFVVKQNDSYQGDWFNSIEFDDRLSGERVEVTATWGFDSELPDDLAAVLAGLFGIHETEVSMVKSKKIEDFSVTYNDGAKLDELVAAHEGTLRKYAQCERAVLHGESLGPVYPY